MPHTHHGMAHKARVRVFAIGQKAETRHEIAHRCDDGLRLLVFQQARVGGNQTVRMRRVHAREDLVAWRGSAGRLALARRAAVPSVGPAATSATFGRVDPAARRKGRSDLVAVMKGVVHSQNGTDRPLGGPIGKQVLHAALLERQLVAVGHAHVLACPALRLHRTRRARARSRRRPLERGRALTSGIALTCLPCRRGRLGAAAAPRPGRARSGTVQGGLLRRLLAVVGFAVHGAYCCIKGRLMHGEYDHERVSPLLFFPSRSPFLPKRRSCRIVSRLRPGTPVPGTLGCHVRRPDQSRMRSPNETAS